MTYYYRSMSSVLQIMKTGYKGVVGASAAGGFIYGTKVGFQNAENVCFVKKNLTTKEYAGEVLCYNMILFSSIMTGTSLATLYGSMFPLTVPFTYYMIKNN